jgi:hypothetical protein
MIILRLGNDRETGKQPLLKKHVSMATREHSNNERDVFYVVCTEMFKQDQLAVVVS